MPNVLLKTRTLSYLKPSINQLLISGLLALMALPLYAKGIQITANSCDVYKLIEQADKPIALSEFKQTPNGINVYSDNLTLQVANFQFCKANQPFSDNKQAIAEFMELEHILSSLADKPIADFPSMNSLSREQLEHAETKDPYYQPPYYQEQLVELYLQAALAQYMGEYVAKDDRKAIGYLSKVVDYYQQVEPEWSTLLSYNVSTNLVRENDRISQTNPITLQHKTDTGLGIVSTVLLSEAGHLDTKAMLILEKLDQWGKAPIPPSQAEIERYLQPVLPELTRHAEQGSYIATAGLAEIYTELASTDSRYKKEADYWQLALKRIPQAEIDWR